jgi:hypothetical protein
MTKRQARMIALEDSAMSIEGSTDLIQQRHPDLTEKDCDKLEAAYQAIAVELRRRATKLATSPG